MLGTRELSDPLVHLGFGPFAVVDVETSGLSSRTDRVLSVAVTTLAPDGEVLEEFHTLLDPGCDPGPVHIHGLSRNVLRGAPEFHTVRDRVADLLSGRVMVAHNAAFDYGFLAGEFGRSGGALPVNRRLCTLALARRVSLPTPDCRLGTLAAHYGIRQTRAHSANDDVRVLTGVLRGLMADAATLGVSLPFLQCPPRGDFQSRNGLPPGRTKPKVACAYSYPGRHVRGEGLTQGMKIAITGATRLDRNVLIDTIEGAGLEVTSSVSRKTSLLLTNEPTSSSAKVRRAAEFGTAVVDEHTALQMVRNVLPGVPKGAPARGVENPKRPQAAPESNGPLAGHRVLVIGGSHDEAAEWRSKIGELGGAPAINMSASVTDVLALPGSERSDRLARARDLGLPIHHDLLAVGSLDSAAPRNSVPTLTRGQVIDLPVSRSGTSWTVRASWAQNEVCTVDVVAFLLDDEGTVGEDADFVFYNQPNGVGARLTTDGPNEESIVLGLDDLPTMCTRVAICAVVDGDETTFGDVGAIEIELSADVQGEIVARSTLDAATTERSLILTEIYLRNGAWRVRSVGQGFEFGLADLVEMYGVDVDG